MILSTRPTVRQLTYIPVSLFCAHEMHPHILGVDPDYASALPSDLMATLLANKKATPRPHTGTGRSANDLSRDVLAGGEWRC